MFNIPIIVIAEDRRQHTDSVLRRYHAALDGALKSGQKDGSKDAFTVKYEDVRAAYEHMLPYGVLLWVCLVQFLLNGKKIADEYRPNCEKQVKALIEDVIHLTNK